MDGFQVTPHDSLDGCVGTCNPAANALPPLWHHAERSKIPVAESVPVRVPPMPMLPAVAAE